MEAALLMFDVAGLVLVALWLAGGNGLAGLFAWRLPPRAAGKRVRTGRDRTGQDRA